MRDIEAASRQRVKRKNIFIRILAALHASRRREVRRVLRRYDHLIDRHSRNATPSIMPDSQQAEESCRNAYGNKSPVRADDWSRRNAAGHSARDQYA
jgi:hypothetical protein